MSDQIDEDQMAADFASLPEPRDGSMPRARQIVEAHIEAYGMVPHPDRIKEAIAVELSVLQVYASDRTHLRDELDRRTTERDYHIRMGDKLADRIREMVPALKEAERFMAYFSGETGGTFVGPGTPLGCLQQIRAAIAAPLHQADAQTK